MEIILNHGQELTIMGYTTYLHRVDYAYLHRVDYAPGAMGKIPIRMVIAKNDPKMGTGFCHELGHVLDKKTWERSTLASEVIAWRIAKSICKEEYWDENDAISCLKIYAHQGGIKVNWDKFRIIPLNKGLKI